MEIAEKKHHLFTLTKQDDVDPSETYRIKENIIHYIDKRDSILDRASETIPNYRRQLRIIEEVSIAKIQKNLKPNEVIADYYLNKDNRTDESHLYIFIIDNKNVKLYDKKNDTAFIKHLRNIRTAYVGMKDFSQDEYNRFNESLHYAYTVLIEPIKNDIQSKKTYLIADEEISFLSFDMLLSNYTRSEITNYANLDYLIKEDYRFSYAYSLPTLYESLVAESQDYNFSVFAPEYAGRNSETKLNFGYLPYQEKLVQDAKKWFPATIFEGKQATKESFKDCLQKGDIIYYSGHASADKNEYEQSALTFSNASGKEINYLYLNDIRSFKVKSPYVILSGCQTGEGKLYSGEGVIHLSHAFLTAGVPATMHTLWNIESDADYRIMSTCIQYLSEGKNKSEALRLAKLKYLESTNDPGKHNPYYWASYISMGNDEPITKRSFFSSVNPAYFIASFIVFIIIGLITLKRKTVSSFLRKEL